MSKQLCAMALCVAVAVGRLLAGAEPADETRFESHLKAGEFAPALQMVESAAGEAERDLWLSRLAQAQATAGATSAALRSAFEINGDALRSSTFGQLAGQGTTTGHSRGGAALADFDSLIELITSTIAPDSWEAVGGPGAIESFPTGVFVDANGVLQRQPAADSSQDLGALRNAAARPRAGAIDQESALRKVSLTRLERHAHMRHAAGLPPDEAMQCLAGMYRVQYLFFYPETRDIVLAGPAGPWQRDASSRRVHATTGAPLLNLDDVVVVLRNSLFAEGRFGCAITPHQQRLADVQAFLADSAEVPLRPGQRDRWMQELRRRLGDQQISVFGIDPRTRTARTIVEADYHMKLIGMGLEEGTLGVDSYLDTVTLDKEGRPPAMDVLRWWFTLNYGPLRTTDAQNAFQLVGPGVKVMSENEWLTERGERVHTGASDELNAQFAHRFTQHFELLARKYPVYAELRNVFDLALLSAAMKQHDLPNRVDWHLPFFGPQGDYPLSLSRAPERVASVINHRQLGRRHLIVGVSGGVLADAGQLLRQAGSQPDTYGLLRPAHEGGQPTRPAIEQWWWD